MPTFLVKPLMYLVAVAAVVVTLGVYRQHLINQGWDNALAKVAAKDSAAASAASAAQATADQCYAKNWYWSTISGTCTEQEK